MVQVPRNILFVGGITLGVLGERPSSSDRLVDEDHVELSVVIVVGWLWRGKKDNDWSL